MQSSAAYVTFQNKVAPPGPLIGKVLIDTDNLKSLDGLTPIPV